MPCYPDKHGCICSQEPLSEEGLKALREFYAHLDRMNEKEQAEEEETGKPEEG